MAEQRAGCVDNCYAVAMLKALASGHVVRPVRLKSLRSRLVASLCDRNNLGKRFLRDRPRIRGDHVHDLLHVMIPSGSAAHARDQRPPANQRRQALGGAALVFGGLHFATQLGQVQGRKAALNVLLIVALAEADPLLRTTFKAGIIGVLERFSSRAGVVPIRPAA